MNSWIHPNFNGEVLLVLVCDSLRATGSLESAWPSVASFPGLPTVQFLIACSMQNKGGRPGHLLMWMTSVSTLGEPWSKRCISRMHSLILNQEWYAFCFASIWNSSTWSRNYKISSLACSFDGRPLPPPSVYLGRHWGHSRNKMDQALWIDSNPCESVKCPVKLSCNSLSAPLSL